MKAQKGYFTFEIDGIQNYDIREVKGLNSGKQEVAEHRAGNSADNHVEKAYGIRKFDDLEVITADNDTINALIAWNTAQEKRNISCIQLDAPVGQGNEIARWDVTGALCLGGDADDLGGEESDVAAVSFTIAVENVLKIS